MRQVIILILTFALLISCAPQATPTPPDVSTTALPTQSESLLQPSAALSWTELRNERFGFGIAIPCWWEFSEMPAEGNISSMSIRNYNDNFFAANSEKGTWKGGRPPQGVISMDITAASGIDSSITVIDAYLQLVDTTTYSVLNTQERTIGNHTFTVVVLKNQINTSEPASVIYLKDLTPDTILIFSTFPAEATFSNDVQIIFSTFVAAEDEVVALPEIFPSPALISSMCPI